MLASLELLHEAAGSAVYRAVLVPKLWQLTLTQHSNVWVDMSIPDIITEVLEWSGLSSNEFELRLDESYDPRELVAQYKEDNLSFISRWMERLVGSASPYSKLALKKPLSVKGRPMLPAIDQMASPLSSVYSPYLASMLPPSS